MSFPASNAPGDPSTPHVAARLLGAFESWRILEPVRRNRAKAVVEDLARRKLSTDSYEVVWAS